MTGRGLWNRYAAYFNAEEGTIFPHDTREMEYYKKLRSIYSGPCLEIGAGSGRLARSLLQNGTTYALEPSDTMITSWSPTDSRLALRVQGTGEELPFLPGSLQFVCFPYNGLQCVLHRSARVAVVKEAFRVLSPGGVFVLEVSPVFGRRGEEPLTQRYRAELPDGKGLILRERVKRCPDTGNIQYHMFYTAKDTGGETTEEVVLELASLGIEELGIILREAGFNSIIFYGDYDLSPYNDELSPRLLAHALKGK